MSKNGFSLIQDMVDILSSYLRDNDDKSAKLEERVKELEVVRAVAASEKKPDSNLDIRIDTILDELKELRAKDQSTSEALDKIERKVKSTKFEVRRGIVENDEGFEMLNQRMDLFDEKLQQLLRVLNHRMDVMVKGLQDLKGEAHDAISFKDKHQSPYSSLYLGSNRSFSSVDVAEPRNDEPDVAEGAHTSTAEPRNYETDVDSDHDDY